MAQTLFDNGFVLASTAPDAPDFFLIPGPNQVAVIWRPSATETTGDPSFGLASQPTGTGGEPNVMYDPNYRRFDVEGYRIYRGRVDTPSQLQLIAQFDYANTVMADWRGQVNPVADCAPELGINTATGGDIGFGCRVPFDSVIPGVAPSVSDTIPLVGPVVQVRLAPEGRQRLATGTVLFIQLDTAINGTAAGCLAGRRSQWGAVHVARYRSAVRVRGPWRPKRSAVFLCGDGVRHQLDSVGTVEPRVGETDKVGHAGQLGVEPAASGTVQVTLAGRGLTLDTAGAFPTLDPETGRFDGPFPPANGVCTWPGGSGADAAARLAFRLRVAHAG